MNPFANYTYTDYAAYQYAQQHHQEQMNKVNRCERKFIEILAEQSELAPSTDKNCFKGVLKMFAFLQGYLFYKIFELIDFLNPIFHLIFCYPQWFLL